MLEITWHNANDGVFLAVKSNRSANYPRVKSESALPEALAQDHNVTLPGPVIAGYKGTAQLGSGADQLKVIGGNLKCPQTLRFTAFSEVKTPGIITRGHFAETLRLFMKK